MAYHKIAVKLVSRGLASALSVLKSHSSVLLFILTLAALKTQSTPRKAFCLFFKPLRLSVFA